MIQILKPSFIDIPEQTKMTLKVDIKYKSNWQQGALKGTIAALNLLYPY